MNFQLFKLQRTFGGDKRFELDSRFLESEEEDEDDHDAHTQSDKVDEEGSSAKYNSKDVTKEVEDGISADLKQEKEMALKVLSNLLGGDFRAEFNQGGQEKEPEFRYVYNITEESCLRDLLKRFVMEMVWITVLHGVQKFCTELHSK